VIAAAASPNPTCLSPENQILFPVNNVMADPIKNKPNALAIVLNTIAFIPVVNINGKTGMIAPIITKKLETQIMELEGDVDKGKIAKFVSQMPISDSKDLRKFISECEPKLDLDRKVMAPSGEMVDVKIAFGVEFFRPFF
jgi:hypothetical protein